MINYCSKCGEIIGEYYDGSNHECQLIYHNEYMPVGKNGWTDNDDFFITDHDGTDDFLKMEQEARAKNAVFFNKIKSILAEERMKHTRNK